jgi:serine protease AprX
MPTPLRARALPCLATALAALAALVAGSAEAFARPPAVVRHDAPVEVIVRLRAGVAPSRGVALVRALGGRVSLPPLPVIHGFAARLPRPAARALAQRPEVAAVSPNAPVRSRDAAADGAEARAAAYDRTVQADLAWAEAGATGRGVGVAVIDTGIAGSLPDFRGDGGSRVRAAVVTNPRATSAEDGYGHGTHVAGVIAGDAGDGQHVGVAPGASLISVKVSDDHGATSVLDVIYGLQFVIQHETELGIRVVNLSLSSSVAESASTDPLDAAVEAAWRRGIVVVAAAGNAGTAADAVSYAPGNDPYVITVGAIDDHGTPDDADDDFASWSSRGRTRDGYDKPDVLAPGAHMVSTLAPGSDFARACLDCVVDGRYFQVGGTSMAAAVVSGGVADLLHAHPGWTPDEVKGALVSTGAPLAGSADRVIRIRRALDATAEQRTANAGLTPNSLLAAVLSGQDVQGQSARWRAATWRRTDGPSWASATWRCDCSLDASGDLDPSAATWRSATWRRTTDFAK